MATGKSSLYVTKSALSRRYHIISFYFLSVAMISFFLVLNLMSFIAIEWILNLNIWTITLVSKP